MSVSKRPDAAAPGESPLNGKAPAWCIYRGTGRQPKDFRLAERLPPPPPWRRFDGGPLPVDDTPPPDDGEMIRRLGSDHFLPEQHVNPHEVDMVNAALYLRRPLLVTGRPGIGKSGLAFRIARELGLGRVLRWAINTHTTLKEGLYGYDAIGRVQAASAMQAVARLRPVPPATRADEFAKPPDPSADPPIGEFVRLGPLGTAFLPRRIPRVLLIDELDKSEADLPNDLLGIFEDGDFPIPELERARRRTPEVTVFTDDPHETATIVDGRVRCHAFPMVIITSNGERDFPPAFLRRCQQLEMPPLNRDQLARMIANHMLDPKGEHRHRLIEEFLARCQANDGLPADKLLDAMFLATSGAYRGDDDASWLRLVDALWQPWRSLVP